MRTFIKSALSLAAVAAILILFKANQNPAATQTPGDSSNIAPVSSEHAVSYMCDGGKTIDVLYGKDGVQVTLSDGRSMALPRSMSADGARYANKDESFVFWNKGNGALVLENNEEKTYIGCVFVAKDPGGLPNVYENGAEGFSMRYPEGFTVDASYVYALDPTKSIHGIKFTIPEALAKGTNLSTDSYVSYESIPNSAACSADMFLDSRAASAHTVTEGDTTYSVSSTTDAAAGNRYEEAVYALPGTNPCIAIRYLIHYGAFENYPAGSIKEFDRNALLATFDKIRKTLVINPAPGK